MQNWETCLGQSLVISPNTVRLLFWDVLVNANVSWFCSSFFFLGIHLILDRKHLNSSHLTSTWVTSLQGLNQLGRETNTQSDTLQQCVGLSCSNSWGEVYHTVCRDYWPHTMCSLSGKFTLTFCLTWFAPFSYVSSYLPVIPAVCRRKAKVSSMTTSTNREAAITFSSYETEL